MTPDEPEEIVTEKIFALPGGKTGIRTFRPIIAQLVLLDEPTREPMFVIGEYKLLPGETLTFVYPETGLEITLG